LRIVTVPRRGVEDPAPDVDPPGVPELVDVVAGRRARRQRVPPVRDAADLEVVVLVAAEGMEGGGVDVDRGGADVGPPEAHAGRGLRARRDVLEAEVEPRA